MVGLWDTMPVTGAEDMATQGCDPSAGVAQGRQMFRFLIRTKRDAACDSL